MKVLNLFLVTFQGKYLLYHRREFSKEIEQIKSICGDGNEQNINLPHIII